VTRSCFEQNGTESKNYGVSRERRGWRREGGQSRIEEYSETLPISSFSPSHHCYTLSENIDDDRKKSSGSE
jgi:hypothetical protein